MDGKTTGSFSNGRKDDESAGRKTAGKIDAETEAIEVTALYGGRSDEGPWLTGDALKKAALKKLAEQFDNDRQLDN